MATIKYKQADIEEFLNQVYTDSTLTGSGTLDDPLHVVGGGGGGGEWGAITGTLSDQTDLQDALDLKADITSIAELAQDAVGAMVDLTLVYTDGTPLLSRAAIDGDIIIAEGSNTAAIAAGVIVNADISGSAAIALSKLATGALPTGITIASANLVDGTIVNADINASAAIAATKIGAGSVDNTEFGYLNGVTSAIQTQLDAKAGIADTETISGAWTFSTIPLLPGSDPTTSNQAARKAYVDAIGQMVDPSLYKNACTCATTTNITLSGEQTIDTFATSSTRVLVWNQSTASQNGIYISSSGAWTRASDYNTAGEVLQGTSTFILDGGVNKNRLFVMNEASVSVLGTDPIGFTPLSSLNSYNPGAGILISGSDISFDPDFISDAISTGTPSAYGVSLNYNSGDLYAVLDYTLLDAAVDPITTSTTTLAILNSGEDVSTITVDDFISESSIVTHGGTLTDNAVLVLDGTTGLTQSGGITIQTSVGVGDRTVITKIDGDQVLEINAGEWASGTGSALYLQGGDGEDLGFGSTGGSVSISGGEGNFRQGSVTISCGIDTGDFQPASRIYIAPIDPEEPDTYGQIDLYSVASVNVLATDGLAIFNSGFSGAGYIKSDNITSNRTFQLPDVSGTFAISSEVAKTTDIQVFTSSGTWTKPSGTPKMTEIVTIGGGGGGGSGRKGAAATVRAGGAGGAGGGRTSFKIQTSLLGATETVTIGTGGAGGASRTTNTTSGASGTAGGSTTFGSWCRSDGGNGGAGGTTAAATGGTDSSTTDGGISASSGAGASSSGSGAAGSAAGSSNGGVPRGGGSAGGITTGNVASAGGAGGGFSANALLGTLAGGTAGAINTAGGAGNNRTSGLAYGGSGGGGGGSSISTNAGAGGAGGLYGGGGGGGGGATNDVGNSGAGGAGADGFCIAITTY